MYDHSKAVKSRFLGYWHCCEAFSGLVSFCLLLNRVFKTHFYEEKYMLLESTIHGIIIQHLFKQTTH